MVISINTHWAEAILPAVYHAHPIHINIRPYPSDALVHILVHSDSSLLPHNLKWARKLAYFVVQSSSSTNINLRQLLRLYAHVTRRFLKDDNSQTSISQVSRLLDREFIHHASSIGLHDSPSTSSAQALPVMSYFTKYLILAAFLCSNIHERMDVILFAKQTQKRSKRRKTARNKDDAVVRQEEESQNCHTSISFTLDRMLAVLHAIAEDFVLEDADVAYQVATLIHSRLIWTSQPMATQSGMEMNPDGLPLLDLSRRLRLSASISTCLALAIASNLQFDLKQYVPNVVSQ